MEEPYVPFASPVRQSPRAERSAAELRNLYEKLLHRDAWRRRRASQRGRYTAKFTSYILRVVKNTEALRFWRNGNGMAMRSVPDAVIANGM